MALGLAVAIAATCGVFTAGANTPDRAPAIIRLDGYRLSGVPGLNGDEITDKLKHKHGDRLSPTDVHADTDAVAGALKARYMEGQLMVTLAEHGGWAWVLFDWTPKYPAPRSTGVTRHFLAQSFAGNTKLSNAALEAAVGLKPGEGLPDTKIDAAQRHVADAYRKAMPGADVHIGFKMRLRPGGETLFTWTITEPDA